ncbi:MAG: ATP-binding protein [Nitrospirae bacterium]|nr:ATP-binding protein [Nitrospirota bacterium]
MALKSVESQNMEFKSNWRDEYLKVIYAFANADGGRLVIGIDDKDDFKFNINNFEGG